MPASANGNLPFLPTPRGAGILLLLQKLCVWLKIDTPHRDERATIATASHSQSPTAEGRPSSLESGR